MMFHELSRNIGLYVMEVVECFDSGFSFFDGRTIEDGTEVVVD